MALDELGGECARAQVFQGLFGFFVAPRDIDSGERRKTTELPTAQVPETA